MRSRSGVRAVNADSNERSRIWSIGVLFLLLFAAVLLASCAEENPEPAETTAGGQPAASLADITTNPEEFFGQTVTVDGAVARIIDPNTFVIVPQGEIDEETAEGDGEFFEDPEVLSEIGVLVAAQGGGTPNLTERQAVQVTGTVQEFDSAFQEEFGLTGDAGPGVGELYTAFEDGAAIAADQVQQSPGETTSQ